MDRSIPAADRYGGHEMGDEQQDQQDQQPNERAKRSMRAWETQTAAHRRAQQDEMEAAYEAESAEQHRTEA